MIESLAALFESNSSVTTEKGPNSVTFSQLLAGDSLFIPALAGRYEGVRKKRYSCKVRLNEDGSYSIKEDMSLLDEEGNPTGETCGIESTPRWSADYIPSAVRAFLEPLELDPDLPPEGVVPAVQEDPQPGPSEEKKAGRKGKKEKKPKKDRKKKDPDQPEEKRKRFELSGRQGKVIKAVLCAVGILLVVGALVLVRQLTSKPETPAAEIRSSKIFLNTEWKVEEDGSYLTFGRPGDEESFKWYESENSDTYMSGKYSLYTGEEAYKKLQEDFSAQGYDEKQVKESLDKVLEATSKESLIFLKVRDAALIKSGKDETPGGTSDGHSLTYYGECHQDAATLYNFKSERKYTLRKVV